MDNFDRRWKQSFEGKISSTNPTLQPSPELFSQVKESMFPQKKKRRGLLMWLLGGLSVSTMLLILIASHSLNQNPSNKLSDHTEGLETNASIVQASKNADINTESLPIKNKTTERIKPVPTSSEVKNTSLESSSAHFNKKNPGEQTVRAQVAEINKTSSTPGGTKLNDARNILTLPVISSYASKNQLKSVDNQTSGKIAKDDQIDNSQPAPLQRVLDNLSNQLLASEEEDNKNNSPITDMNLLPNLQLYLLDESSAIDVAPTLHQINVKQRTLNAALWRVEGQFEYVKWQDRLGSNYAAILNPADFYSVEKSGYGMSVGLVRDFGSRFSASIGGRIQRIHSGSGHHSAVIYDVNDEMDPLHNTTELTLGTPYGLLKSEVTFRRSGEVVENQEMQIDVQSEHQFTAFSIYGDVRFALIQKPSWRLDVLVGPEWTFLSTIDNQVEYGILNTNDIAVAESHLLATQNNVNANIFGVRGGLQVSKDLSDYWQLVVGGDWTEGLTSTFDNDGLGSYSRRYSAHLGLNLRLK
jgi:hypothetical protein